ncbi:MAG: hypothetical protein DI570_09945 [Phenylobacterium zucineum]|nr:MAG: hypothetical protein DI570_09945 [Phenylobacterium zucineum]
MAGSFTAQVTQDTGMAGLKLSPPITVYALTLNEWVAVATLLYLALQAGYLAWKWQREWRRVRP